MYKCFLLVFLFVSVSCYSQSFDGVPISGDVSTAISRLKAKGYVVLKYYPQAVRLSGKVANRNLELWVFSTPISKKVFKMIAYLPEQSSWYSLRISYSSMLETLINKYGQPDDYANTFITPYYEGDGYELQAIELEKMDYHAYWFKRNNLTVGVEISKFKQVKLSYENNLMMDVKDREQTQIENNSF